MKTLCSLLTVCCLAIILAPAAMAQNSASILGNVSDSSGAAMPNVKITVSLPAQGFQVNTVSDAAGAYKVGFLGIGDYTITAEAPGFQKLVQTDVHLELGATQRVDLAMKVGQTTQEVTVTGNVVKVQTDDSVLSSVITGTQIAAINLDGREFVALGILVPGAEVTNGYNPSTSQGEGLSTVINFNGTHYDQSEYTVDGGNLNNYFANGNFHTTPSIESIAEFKISTSQYEADSGIKMGANVEMVTKSGTRDFHGDMYEFIRNQAVDANPWFTNQQLWSGLASSPANLAQYCGGSLAGPCNAPKATLKWNDFGFTLGGPFFIPGHYNTNKSKTFVFWSSEWRRILTGTTISSSAPTVRMRAGDFSECDSKSANYNKQISGCTLPSGYGVTGDQVTSIAPQATALLNTWVPLPNNGPTSWLYAPVIPNNWRQDLIRVDQNIGDKNRFYVKGAWDVDRLLYATTLNNTNGSTFNAIQSYYGGQTWNWAAHLTTTFSPTIVNDFMAHYDERLNVRGQLPGSGWGPGVLQKPAGWSMPSLFPANQNQPLLPGFNVSGGDGMGTFAEDPNTPPQWTEEENQIYQDTIQITHGHHYIKMGLMFASGVGDFNVSMGSSTAEGELTFSSGSTASSKNAMADLLIGNINSYTESSPQVNGKAIGGYFGFKFYVWRIEPYIQDDWRVNKRLTLNLGVRSFYLIPWEDQSMGFNLQEHGVAQPMLASFYPSLYNPAVEAPLDKNGNFAINAAMGQIYNPHIPGNGLLFCGQGGIQKGCMNVNGLHFAPRFGFAFQPFSNPNTVIRGGYGIFYDQMSNNDPAPTDLNGQSPIYLTSSSNNTATSALGTGYNLISPAAYGPAAITTITPTLRYPMAQDYTIGVQREFKDNTLLAVNYVGTLVHHNPRTVSFNRVSIAAAAGTINVPSLAGTTDCDSSGNCNVQASLINSKHSINYFRPYEGYSTISQRETSASSDYQSVQLELRHPVGHGLTLEAAYTFSKWMTDADSYSNNYNVNDDNLSRYWAPSSYNRTQVLTLQYVYDLPFLKNNGNHYVKNALGGWQMTGVTTFWTGLPINLTCSESGFGNGTSSTSKCNSLAPMKIRKGMDNNPTFGPEVQWYDPSTVGQIQLAQLSANNQPGMFGWMGNYTLVGPGRNNWDLALLKNFSAPWFKGEHSSVQFRLETYNTFNHPQWQGISSGCSSTTPFGNPCNYATTPAVVNLGQGDVTSAWAPRNVQFALKWIF